MSIAIDGTTYGGDQPTWRREGPIYRVKIDTAESGIEVRTVWGDPPVARYRYIGELILQASLSEVTNLVATVDDAYGSADSFNIADPGTGATVAVRMDGPLVLSQYRGVTGWWSASITCISVVT